MANVFVVDIDTKENIGIIDFIPAREERIIIRKNNQKLEYKIQCVLHDPLENATIIFAKLVDTFYSSMKIKW